MAIPTGVKASDDRVRLHVRVAPRIHRQFKAVAHLLGETIEGRIERLMAEDVENNRDALTAAPATAAS